MVGLLRDRLLAAWRSTKDRNTLHFKRRLVSVAKEFSTELSQEHEVRGKVEDEAQVVSELGQDLRLLVGGVVVEDDADELAGQHGRLEAPRKRMNSWCRWRGMRRPSMLPLSTLRAANRVEVPWR